VLNGLEKDGELENEFGRASNDKLEKRRFGG